jgi:integration host factor subunit beta
MTKSELIDRLSHEMQLPKKRAEEAVNCIFDKLARSLSEGQRIEIRGFGSFSLKQHREYTGRNPKTGEEVPVSRKYSIHFKVGKQLREQVDSLPAGTQIDG